MSHSARRPDPDTYAEAYRRYIELVPEGPVVETLARQVGETIRLVADLDERRAGLRYAPGKWSVREVIGHVIDSERVFAYRALRFARGDRTPLPGFDENAWAVAAPHERVTIRDLAAELACVREATVYLLSRLDATAWRRGGEANGRQLTVGALAWAIAGHELHHRAVLRERYRLI